MCEPFHESLEKPFFVIKKVSGAWHMLQDLWKVIERMELVDTT